MISLLHMKADCVRMWIYILALVWGISDKWQRTLCQPNRVKKIDLWQGGHKVLFAVEQRWTSHKQLFWPFWSSSVWHTNGWCLMTEEAITGCRTKDFVFPWPWINIIDLVRCFTWLTSFLILNSWTHFQLSKCGLEMLQLLGFTCKNGTIGRRVYATSPAASRTSPSATPPQRGSKPSPHEMRRARYLEYSPVFFVCISCFCYKSSQVTFFENTCPARCCHCFSYQWS